MHASQVRRPVTSALGLTFSVLSICLASPALAESHTTPCSIPKSWATDGVPDPITLAQGEFNSFCAFHLWSWNAFLWMMDKSDASVRFEAFPTGQETIDESFSVSEPHTAPTLRLRAAKGDHPIDDIAQAGTLGLLVTPNKRAVYYSEHVNPRMYEDIVSQDWNSAKGLAAAPDTAQFAVGDIELKAAWAVVDDDHQVPGAYTRKAEIPLLVNVPHQGITTVTIPPDPTYVEAEVALIGLHVVGWVNGHSEAIWATFTPRGIAPLARPDAAPMRAVSLTSTPVYKAGTPAADCNQEAIPVQSFDESTQLFSISTQVCQVYRNGSFYMSSETSSADAKNIKSNNEAIDQLNASVLTVMPDTNLGRTYIEVGAVWSNADDPKMPDAKINVDFQDALVGSQVLSNPVIETFTQTDVGQHNCFSCHNSLQFQPNKPTIVPLQPSRLNLSHFLMQIYVDTFGTAN